MSTSILLAGVLFGAVGVGYVLYGRKQRAPLPLVETSHLLSSLGGVALLLIGQGLQRRSHAAWVLALAGSSSAGRRGPPRVATRY